MRALFSGCFGGSSTFAARSAAGTASLLAALVVLGGCAAETGDGAGDADVAVNESAICSGSVGLTVTPNTPGLTGIVELKATGWNCGVDTPEFRFQIQPFGGAFTNLSAGYQLSDTFNWDTSLHPAGRYALRVQVRMAGAGLPNPNVTSASQNVWVGPTCYAVSQTALPNTPQLPGTVFTFTANASCTAGATPEYRFVARPVGGTVLDDIVVSDWGDDPDGVATWDSTGDPSNRYNVTVSVRHEDNTGIEAADTDQVQFGAQCSFTSFGTTPPPPFAAPGTNVTMSAAATCTGGVTPEFRYLYRPQNTGAFQALGSGWTTATSMSWDTAALMLAEGPYDLRFEVRGTDVAAISLQNRNIVFTLSTAYCHSVTLNHNPAPPQLLLTPVALTTTHNCTGANPQFRFVMTKPDATVITLKDWSTDDFANITNEANISGSYTLRVDARDGGSTATQASASRAYNFGATCGTQAAIVAPTTADLGTTIPVTASATCTGGATPHYQMAYRLGAGGAFTNFHGYSATATGQWNTSGLTLGTYTVRVFARASTNTGPAESTRTHTIELVCPAGYESDGLGGCQDVDECTNGGNNCDPTATCDNTPGSFTCTCPPDTTDINGDGSACPVVDECADGSNDCDPAAVCTNVPNSYTCTCPPGTIDVNGDGTECSAVVVVSGGSYFSCGITATGNLYCWGQNSSGQLGNGGTTQATTPVQVGSDDGWSAVAAGYLHACGILGGEMYCWGENADGELGDGTTNDSTTPVQVGGAADWTHVSVGYYHSCGIRSGQLWCWGWGGEGELGNGAASSTTPLRVGTDADWSAVAAGGFHTCGLRGASAYCWGYNVEGQLGIGNNTTTTSPAAVSGASGWTALTAGAKHTCGVRSGIALCWGQNHRSMIGDSTTVNKNVPTTVSGGFDDWTAVSAGTYHTCGLRGTGLLYCWGFNSNGEVGDGATYTRKAAPVQVGVETDWSGIGIGEFHSCGVRAESVYCWGYNSNGQLGDGTTTRRNTVGGAISF